MAWTEPSTYAVGGTASADIFNSGIRDNLDYLYNEHPHVRVRLDVAQSIPNNNSTRISFTTVDWNVTTAWVSTSGSKIHITEAGLWRFIPTPVFAGNTSGYRQVTVRVNGAATAEYVLVQALAADTTTVPFSQAQPIELSVTTADFVECWVLQNSGAALNLLGATTSGHHTMMSARWVSS